MTATRERRWSDRWKAIAVVVGTTLVAFAISALAMVMYTSGARGPREFSLLIPDGTAAAIAGGENPLEIPSTWRFQSGDVLTLVNEDGSGHWLGELWVPPGETTSYTLRPSIAGVFSCSLHPDGSIAIDVEVRGFDWRLVAIPTLAFGPLMGVVALVIRRVFRALG